MKKLHLWNGIVSVVVTFFGIVGLLIAILSPMILDSVESFAGMMIIVGAAISFLSPITIALLIINILLIVKHEDSTEPTYTMVTGILGLTIGMLLTLYIVSGIMSLIQVKREDAPQKNSG